MKLFIQESNQRNVTSLLEPNLEFLAFSSFQFFNPQRRNDTYLLGL